MFLRLILVLIVVSPAMGFSPLQEYSLQQEILFSIPGNRFRDPPPEYRQQASALDLGFSTGPGELKSVSQPQPPTIAGDTPWMWKFDNDPEPWFLVREEQPVGVWLLEGNGWFTLYHGREDIYSLQVREYELPVTHPVVGLLVDEDGWALEYVKVDSLRADGLKKVTFDVILNGKSLRDSLDQEMVYGFHKINRVPFYFSKKEGYSRWNYGDQSSRDRWWFIYKVHGTAYKEPFVSVVVEPEGLTFLGWDKGNWEIVQLTLELK